MVDALIIDACRKPRGIGKAGKYTTSQVLISVIPPPQPRAVSLEGSRDLLVVAPSRSCGAMVRLKASRFDFPREGHRTPKKDGVWPAERRSSPTRSYVSAKLEREASERHSPKAQCANRHTEKLRCYGCEPWWPRREAATHDPQVNAIRLNSATAIATQSQP